MRILLVLPIIVLVSACMQAETPKPAPVSTSSPAAVPAAESTPTPTPVAYRVIDVLEDGIYRGGIKRAGFLYTQ